MGFGSGGGFTPGRNNLVGDFTTEGNLSASSGITGSSLQISDGSRHYGMTNEGKLGVNTVTGSGVVSNIEMPYITASMGVLFKRDSNNADRSPLVVISGAAGQGIAGANQAALWVSGSGVNSKRGVIHVDSHGANAITLRTRNVDANIVYRAGQGLDSEGNRQPGSEKNIGFKMVPSDDLDSDSSRAWSLGVDTQTADHRRFRITNKTGVGMTASAGYGFVGTGSMFGLNLDNPAHTWDINGTLCVTGSTILGNNITSSVTINGSLTGSQGITGSSYYISSPSGEFGLANDGGLTVAQFNANWTNAGITVADLGSVTTCDINGGTINGITDLAVADGGTGASTAADARTNLGVDAAGTDNSTNVTLAGTPNYLTLSSQEITLTKLDISDDTNLVAGTGLSLSTNTLSVDASQTQITAVGTLTGLTVNGNATISDGTNDFDVASHDGTNGLKLGGVLVTSTAAELNILDGVTSTAAELNILDGVTSTAAELNLLDADNTEPTDAAWASLTRWAKAEYDFAANGGTVGAKDLAVTIPDNAVIVGGFIDVVTAFTDTTATATVAIHVATADDIVSANSLATLGYGSTGLFSVSPSSGATAVKTSVAANITLTIATEALTAGKALVWLQYVISE